VLIESLHKRWVMLLETVREIDFNRNVGIRTDDVTGPMCSMYEWNEAAIVAHITALRQRAAGRDGNKSWRTRLLPCMKLRDNSCTENT